MGLSYRLVAFGRPWETRTPDTLIKSHVDIFQDFGLFQSWNRPKNYSIFKQSG